MKAATQTTWQRVEVRARSNQLHHLLLQQQDPRRVLDDPSMHAHASTKAALDSESVVYVEGMRPTTTIIVQV